MDSCPLDANNDADVDAVCGNVDSCAYDAENDADSDDVCGDVDSCKRDAANDVDSDELCGDVDSCARDNANDVDSDTLCADEDLCPLDAENDADADAVCGDVDSCSHDTHNDADADNMCGGVDGDSCPFDPANDWDADGVCGDVDSCPLDASNDADADSVCAPVDSCPDDADNDGDSDLVCANEDSCPLDGEDDSDSDELCSDVDTCPYDAENDADSDQLCATTEDTCPYDAHNDVDSDSLCGDADSCPLDGENDLDADGLCKRDDHCPNDPDNDADSDDLCGDVDSCPDDAENDFDQNGVCDGSEWLTTEEPLSQAEVDLQAVFALIEAIINGTAGQNATADFVLNDDVLDMLLLHFANVTSGVGIELLDEYVEELARIGDVIAVLGTNVDSPLLELYLGMIDTYAEALIEVGIGAASASALAALDAAVEAACAALALASSDSSSGTSDGAATVGFDEGAFSLFCVLDTTSNSTADDTDGSNTDAVVVVSDSLTFVAPSGAGGTNSTVTLTSWPSDLMTETGNGANATSVDFMSSVQGVTITSGDGESVGEEAEDGVDGGFQLSIPVTNTNADVNDSGDHANGTNATTHAPRNGTNAGIRKRVSCLYFDRDLQVWSRRGMYMRGLLVTPTGGPAWLRYDALSVSAICVSSHLTLFAVADDIEGTTVVEKTLQQFGQRFKTLGSIETSAEDESVNYLVPLIFVLVTLVFVLTVALANRGFNEAKGVEEARQVFLSSGALRKPGVIRGVEFDGMLRGWIPTKEVFALIGLHLVTSNSFVGLAFRWNFDRLVFGIRDRAFILYAGVLSTFLVNAFLFDETGRNSLTDTFATALEKVFVSALFARLITFPVKYGLPYMMTNVHSMVSAAGVSKSVVDQLWARLWRYVFCGSDRHRRRKVKAGVVEHWRLDVAKRQMHAKKLQEEAERRARAAATTTTTTTTAAAVVLTEFGTKWSGGSNNVRTGGSGGGAVDKTESPAATRANANAALLRSHVNVVLGSLPTKKQRADRLAATSFKRGLNFLCMQVPLPHARRREAADEDATRSLDLTVSSVASLHKHLRKRRVLTKFQQRIRRNQSRLKDLRRVEFEAWVESRRQRLRLSHITISFLVLYSCFVLFICLLVSAAFSMEECVLWVLSVGKSLLMQLFVTDPLITFVVLSYKLFSSWVLLTANRVRNERKREEEWKAREIQLAAAEALVLQQLAMAQHGGSGGDAWARRQQSNTLQKRLADIMAAKERVREERRRAAVVAQNQSNQRRRAQEQEQAQARARASSKIQRLARLALRKQRRKPTSPSAIVPILTVHRAEADTNKAKERDDDDDGGGDNDAKVEQSVEAVSSGEEEEEDDDDEEAFDDEDFEEEEEEEDDDEDEDEEDGNDDKSCDAALSTTSDKDEWGCPTSTSPAPPRTAAAKPTLPVRPAVAVTTPPASLVNTGDEISTTPPPPVGESSLSARHASMPAVSVGRGAHATAAVQPSTSTVASAPKATDVDACSCTRPPPTL